MFLNYKDIVVSVFQFSGTAINTKYDKMHKQVFVFLNTSQNKQN